LGSAGEYNREKRDDTQKTGANEKRRLRKKVRDYGRSLLLQRMRERDRENEERDYSFLFSFNVNIVYTKERDANSRKQRSACLLSDLVCERKCMR
jgi:hypothetical protein